uniref:Glucosamine/galactosamine-6-phosphate isomerase domain-containing protein n=1 Tax=Hemiselmis andersenii TaxID=464988 RepID=A0A7S1ED86_HEMAN|mmetsp:Transcript_42661/g.104133  ORF Transcript_42661/g.104133 Transcript_42661/m.104133 type:complete len:296 (+) Transcript_42661:182-1069(+)
MIRPIILLAALLSCTSAAVSGASPSLKPSLRPATTLRLSGGAAPSVPQPSATKSKQTIHDGREVYVLADSDAISAAVAESVAAIGKECIASQGTFTMCVPGGSIVKALSKLPPDSMDFSKVHVFFANERIGEYKCYKGAMDSFVDKCGIPHANVHKVGEGEPAEVAAAYEAEMLKCVAKNDKGIPVMDLVLLGTGEDGHVGSIHPNSDEVMQSGKGKVILPIDKGGKKSIAASMDVFCASSRIILSAAGAGRAPMVKAALSGDFEEWTVPAGLVKSEAGATAWLCDQESVATLNH